VNRQAKKGRKPKRKRGQKYRSPVGKERPKWGDLGQEQGRGGLLRQIFRGAQKKEGPCYHQLSCDETCQGPNSRRVCKNTEASGREYSDQLGQQKEASSVTIMEGGGAKTKEAEPRWTNLETR